MRACGTQISASITCVLFGRLALNTRPKSFRIKIEEDHSNFFNSAQEQDPTRIGPEGLPPDLASSGPIDQLIIQQNSIY